MAHRVLRRALRRWSLITLMALSLFLVQSSAQALAQSGAQTAVQDPLQPVNRIVAPVSNTALSTLKGNVHPLAQARYDRGAASASLATGRMTLLLRRSATQATALSHYLDDLQTPSSPHYRQWLTPESYGRTYGVSDADLAAVETWLGQQGFRIERVPAGRNAIVFSGTFGSVKAAFHTSIHRYSIDGVQHYANVSDPQIPSALAPVVAGIAPMNDFRYKPQHEMGPQGVYDAGAKRIKPQLTLHGGTSAAPTNYLFVDPADAATIYNTPNALLNRNYAAAQSLDGTGVTIGILGYSELPVDDVANYRQAFLADGSTRAEVAVVVDGNDPPVYPGGNAIEALLDTEIAGALAPGVHINYYTAESTDLSDGLSLAALRAIDDNQVSILDVSYGSCEANLGVSGNEFFSEIWEQAAAQGISVLVSSGDSGSAGCDNDNEVMRASNGLAVNGLASTPYNIAVGGTDFDVLVNSFAQYGTTSSGTAPYYGTALGYIPEATWNNSVVSDRQLAANTPFLDATTGDTNIAASGGGASCAINPTNPGAAAGVCPGTLTGYPKPAFQASITANDGVRDLPDVSLFAANGQYQATWVLCSDSTSDGNTSQSYTNCQTQDGSFYSGTNFDGIGGTSAAAPAMAGVLALVSQSLGGARLGQASNVLYNLASGSSAASIFHRVQGNNSVPCVAGSPNCSSNEFLSGYDSGGIYSEAAGLGSVDATELIHAWGTAAFTPTTTSLTAGTAPGSLGPGSISVTHGTPLYFGAAVSPAGAVGTVSLSNTSGAINGGASYADMFTLGSDGTGVLGTNDLPGGTYTVSGYYGGDATHSASSSTPGISVTVAPESSSTALSLAISDPATGQQVSGTTMPYGFYAFLNAQVYGNASTRDGSGNILPDGIPTGTVVLLSGDTEIDSASINSLGYAQEPLRYLSPGTYSIDSKYSGDASFNGNSSAMQPLTITPAQVSIVLQPSAASIAPSATLSLLATLATDSLGLPPEAEMTLTSNGNTLQAYPQGGSAPNGTALAQATFAIPASQLASGANTLTASFPGDQNYAAASTSTVVTVDPNAPAPAFTLAGPASGITIAAPGQSGTGTITLAPVNGFTGNISLSCSVATSSIGVTPTCSVPSTATLSGTASTTAALTVNTTASGAAGSTPAQPLFPRVGEIALGGALLLMLGGRRRTWTGGVALLCLGALLGLGATCGAIGCGGGGSSSTPTPTPGTPAGSYTVNITGVSGSLTTSTKVTVTVQ